MCPVPDFVGTAFQFRYFFGGVSDRPAGGLGVGTILFDEGSAPAHSVQCPALGGGAGG
jgi:hypothetical protein